MDSLRCHSSSVCLSCVREAIIEIPAWHPLLRPMTEERRGFFQPQQTLPSLSIVIPNTMTVMRLLLGGKEEARGGDGRFQVLPSLEDVHTSFQRRPGDVLHSLRLPRPQDRTSYPLKLVSDEGYVQCDRVLLAIRHDLSCAFGCACDFYAVHLQA